MNTYKMTLEDSVDSMTFDLLEVPIVDKDVEGAVDNTTLDGNIFTDYLWLKKNYVQKWSIMCDDEYSRLRGFYTRQFDNASVPTYKLFYGENISQDQVVSGDYILVNNPTEKNAPITSFELLGDATQTTYSGKNLLNINGTINSSHISAITASGQSLTITTTATTSTARATIPINYEANRQMTISFDATCLTYEPTASNSVVVYMRTVGGSDPLSPSLTLGHTVGTTVHYRTTVTTDNITTRELWFYLKSSPVEGVVSYRFDNIQVEYGASETAYEPYVGGTASPNPDYPQAVNTVTGENTVKIEGKNLCYEANRVSTTTLEFFCNCANIADTTATLSLITDVTTTATVYSFVDGVDLHTSLGTISLMAGQRSSISLNLTNIMSQIRAGSVLRLMIYRGGAGFTTLSDAQLELGSTATAYEPYQGQEFPIDLGSIELAKIGNYQDRIYKTDGKWYIEKQVGKVVLDGSETWGKNEQQTQATTSYYFTTIANAMTNSPFISDKFSRTTIWGTDNEGMELLSGNNNLRLRIKTSLASSVAELTTWFSTHPTTVYYALATPTTTEITNSELVGQLEAILQAYLYTGTNNISNNAVSPNLAGQMNIGYKLIFSEETVLIEPTAVRLTLTDGGIINVCGCRQNVQLTMRETIQ